MDPEQKSKLESSDEEPSDSSFQSKSLAFLEKNFPWLLNLAYFVMTRLSIWQANPIHKELEKVNRVDFFPSSAGGRGFVIVLDEKMALYFNQDGDHFVYDGWEMGEYEKGSVTILDGIAEEEEKEEDEEQ